MAAEPIKPYFYTICVTDKTQTFCCHVVGLSSVCRDKRHRWCNG